MTPQVKGEKRRAMVMDAGAEAYLCAEIGRHFGGTGRCRAGGRNARDESICAGTAATMMGGIPPSNRHSLPRMDPTQTAIVFADAKTGAPFLFVLSLGLLLAGGLFLLRPWPPRLARGLMFALVLVICGAGVFYALLDRKLVVDRSTQEVAQSARILGLGRRQAWKFGEFQTVRVEYRPIRVNRESGMSRSNPGNAERHDNYVVELVGPGATVYVRSYDEASEAERVAANVARAGSWQARRLGYRVRTGSGQPGEGIAAGELQSFETPSGQQGIGMSLEAWTQIQIESGAESVIEVSP